VLQLPARLEETVRGVNQDSGLRDARKRGNEGAWDHLVQSQL
jgi:hypothetical protein